MDNNVLTMSRSTRNPPKSRTTTHPHPEASSSSSTNNHNHPDPSSSKKTASDSTPHDEDEDDPFTNLDPSLDTVTLNSLSQAQAQVQAQSQSENDSSLARDDHNHNHDNSHTPNGVLEDFANQALEVSSTSEDRHLLPSSGIRISGIEIGIGSSLGNVDEDVDGEHGDVDTDAANLLAFTNGEDGGLFGSSSSHPGRKPFGELLQAADQGGIGLPGEDGEHHVGVEGDGGVGHVEHDEGQGQENEHDHQHDHGHGHGQGQGDEGLYVDHEGQLLNDAESELDSTALNLARAAVGRSFESRKRKYGEGMENENGDPMDIAKMKKESHVCETPAVSTVALRIRLTWTFSLLSLHFFPLMTERSRKKKT